VGLEVVCAGWEFDPIAASERHEEHRPGPPREYRQTGEIAKDAVSGEALMTIGVVYIEDGESSLIKVTVPEGGVSEGLAPGAPVSLPGLVARPWESVFNGQQRHGIAYRAAAITPAAFRPPRRPPPDDRHSSAPGGGWSCRRTRRRDRLRPGQAPGGVLVRGRPSHIHHPAAQLVGLGHGGGRPPLRHGRDRGVYRKQIRPVTQTGAVVMDGIFGTDPQRP
jgi:hypothetical protein